MTCEQCGADAVDGGVCQRCGWRVPADRATSGPDAAYLAETREADIPARSNRPVAARNFGPPTPYPTSAGAAPITPRMAPRSGVTGTAGPGPGPGGAYGATGPSTNRFCGTCGAQLEAGQMFCGQCGAAVSSFEGSAVNHPTATNTRGDFSAPGYGSADDEVWSPADQDAPTEQFMPIQGGPARGGAYRGSGAYAPLAPTRGMSRELQVLLGILCILGALISGAGALILAFVK